MVILVLLVLRNDCFAIPDIPASNSNIRLPVDSLKVLDSLVNVSKVSNNELAVIYARRALAMARLIDSKEAIAKAYGLLGMAHMQHQKDSSYYFFNLALKIADESQLKDHKVIITYNLAALYNLSYDYKTAIQLLDTSIQIARLVKDYSGISHGYNMLGSINLNTNDVEKARQMFDSAFYIAERHMLYKDMGVAMGNIARFESDVAHSISLQREALNYLRQIRGAEEEMANIYINMGNRFTNPDSALYHYKKALDLAVNAKLPKILMGAYNNMAYSYLDKGDVVLAENCLRDHAIPIALRDGDNDWLSSLYDTYADVFVQKGDYRNALLYQKKASHERDIDNKKKASEQVRLLSALLDIKNKELIIQNEERELLIQRNRLQKTELWLAITLAFVILSVFTMLILQQRSRVRFQREKISSARKILEMEESEKGRTARELHDLTGQLVLGISGAIEDIDFPDPEIKEQIRDRIKELGKSIRQISHRMNRAMIEHFTFSELITGLCADVKKLSGLAIELSIPDEFPALSNEVVLHFYRITQELLTNAAKYAAESKVNITIQIADGNLVLNYFDSGPGFTPGEKKRPGMGFMNIFERAKLVNGMARVHSEPGKGTHWEVNVPVNPRKNNVKS
jgi:signal transduction histidine kinase